MAKSATIFVNSPDDDDQSVKASISSAHAVVEEGDGFSVRPRQAFEWTCAVCF